METLDDSEDPTYSPISDGVQDIAREVLNDCNNPYLDGMYLFNVMVVASS
jgi:hypothetical protein